MRARPTGTLLLILAAVASAQDRPAPSLEKDVSVRLQQIYVTVTDASGERIRDLSRDDFEIRDEGTREQIITFEKGDIPFTAVLLVDASTSMAGAKLSIALAGAQSFIDGMAELDEAKLMVYSDRLEASTPFASKTARIAGELEVVRPSGGTATNDYLYMALKLLEPRQGRRVVIVLSDGVDVHSALRAAEVLHKARHSQAIVYWIRVRQLERAGPVGVGYQRHRLSAWRSSQEHDEQLGVLEETVRESGGRVIPVPVEPEISRAFAEVLHELREQYVLGYYVSNPRHDQSWRRVEVRVGRPGSGSVKRGYIDF